MKPIFTTLLFLAFGVGLFLALVFRRPDAAAQPPPQLAPSASVPVTSTISSEQPAASALQAPSAVQTLVPAITNPPNPAEMNDIVNSTNELASTLASLASDQTDSDHKRSLFQKLRETGKLDEAIDALKSIAAAHPDQGKYPCTVGELILQKLGVMAREGAPMNQMGILGMQADMFFDAALKLEPENWDAQFYKAAAMAHWPLELNKAEEVVSRFSNLIDLQERSSPHPEFVNSYVLLGDYFQKLGQSDRAAATWQLGLQKFPGDQLLSSKLAQKQK